MVSFKSGEYEFVPITDADIAFYKWFSKKENQQSGEVIQKLASFPDGSFLSKCTPDDLNQLLKIDIRHSSEPTFQKAEAIRRYLNGEIPTHTTAVCENITCGFGEVSSLGYWEFPLWPEDFKRAESDMDWCIRKGKLNHV